MLTDSTLSVPGVRGVLHLDAIQQKSGHKRKRTAQQQLFDDRCNDLMHFKAGVQQFQHEMVSNDEEIDTTDSTPSSVRAHSDAIQQKSGNKRKSTGPTQRSFDDHFNDLMAFKAMYGHCHVSQRDQNTSLGNWCKHIRSAYKKLQNNQKTATKLSNAQIQRLNGAGFKWCKQKREFAPMKRFDERFKNDLMSFKKVWPLQCFSIW